MCCVLNIDDDRADVFDDVVYVFFIRRFHLNRKIRQKARYRAFMFHQKSTTKRTDWLCFVRGWEVGEFLLNE